MPLYHLIGALDPLTDADIAKRINDGLPETLGEWIAADGLTHLKIKLNGDDLAWDVERVLAIERVAAEAQAARDCTAWHYSADFNEHCPNVEYLLDFLARVGEQIAGGARPAAIHRAADRPRSQGEPREPDARRRADQAGRHRRIARRSGKPAIWPASWATRAWRSRRARDTAGRC